MKTKKAKTPKAEQVKYYKVVSAELHPICQNTGITYGKGIFTSGLCEDEKQECAQGIYFLDVAKIPMWWQDGTKNTRKIMLVKPLGKVVKVSKGFRTDKLQVIKVLSDIEVAALGRENNFDWYSSTQTAGYRSTQTAGDSSTQTAGYRSTQTAGDSSTQTAGYRSTQTAGDSSTQTAGYRSTQTAGYRSTQTAGYSSTQTAGYRSTQTAGDSSTQTAGYRSTQTAGDSSTQTAGDSSTQTAGDSSTQTAGYRSTQTAGDSSTQTAGDSSTQTAGDWSTHIAWGDITYQRKRGKHIIVRQIWSEDGDYTHAILDLDIELKNFKDGDIVKIVKGKIIGIATPPNYQVGMKVRMIAESCNYGGSKAGFINNCGGVNEAVIGGVFTDNDDVHVNFKNGDKWVMKERELEPIPEAAK